MHFTRDTALRQDFGSGVGSATPTPLWRTRVLAAARGPWARPTGRALATLGAVLFLSWLGARSAESTTPSGPEPKPASLVTMASPAVSARPLHAPRRDAGTDAGKSSDAASDAPRGVLSDGRVVLNAANEQELCRLPGVGPARAEKIVALRERLGRFRSDRQLLRVRGIGPRTLARLRPHLVLDAPEEEKSGE